MPGITVGFDGSENSHRALEWAMKEAAIRRAPLTVLAVHQALASYWTASPVTSPQDIPETRMARQAAEDAVSKAASQLGDAQPHSVTVNAVHGFADQELINAAQDSDLLVLSRRGGGGFAELMMGSITSKVVNHAACPVVVVPASR